MQALLLSDTHGSVSLINEYAELVLRKYNIVPNFCIHAGDLGTFAKRYTPEWYDVKEGRDRLVVPTYVALGNHEDAAEFEDIMNGNREVYNLNFFKRGGEMLTFNEEGYKPFTIMGVPGAPCVDNPKIRWDYNPKDYLVALKRWENVEKPKIDLLVTHESPTGTGSIGDWAFGNPENCGVPELRELWEALNCNHLGGHYHIDHVHEERGFTSRILPMAEEGAKLLDTVTGEVIDLAI